MGQFDKYLYTFPQEGGEWFGMITPRGFLRGNKELKTSNLTIDFTALTKAQPMDVPHFHPIDEYILFIGADLKEFFDFDAELHFWIGEDPEHMEMVPIKQSSIIRVPAGTYHAPTFFKEFRAPLDGSALYPSGDFRTVQRREKENGAYEYVDSGEGIGQCTKNPKVKCTFCGKCVAEQMAIFEKDENGELSEAAKEYLRPYYEMAEKNQTHRFDKYIYPFQPMENDNPNLLGPRAGFRGEEEIEGARVSFMFNIVQKECQLGDLHMHPNTEEYLFFFGSDIKKFFDFDAVIEVRMGEDPDHMETYTFDKPTVVQIPQGIWHGPVTFRRIGAPINYMPVYLNGKYGKVVREGGVDVYKTGGIPE